MSNASFDKEKGSDPEVVIPTLQDTEDEGQIRARLGRYGLGRLFDAGGLLPCVPIADMTG